MKRYKTVFLFLVLLINPYRVYADNIDLECPNEVSVNSEFTCKLIGNSSYDVVGIEMDYNYSNSLSLISFMPASEWVGDGEDKQISLFHKDETSGKFEIGTLKFKSNNQNATISLDNIKFYDDTDDVAAHSVESTYKNIKIKSKNDSPKSDDNDENIITESDEKEETTIASSTYLTDIIIENYDLVFYKETYAYELKIANENKLNITPILEDKSSTYEIIGNEDLVNGSVIKIKIMSQDDQEKTYTIKINKSIEKTSTLPKSKIKIGFIVIIVLLVIGNLARIVLKKVRRDKDE